MKPRWIFAVGALVLLVGAMPSHAQWATNPTVNNPICTALNFQATPTIISDGAGGAIITWFDYRNGYTDIYAQRIDASGVVQWTADGAAVCTTTNNQHSPTLVSDGAGGAIITWYDYRNSSSYSDIYVQRINAAGVVQWAVDGVALCTATNSQYTTSIASDGAGGAIITWLDFRNNSSYSDIYVQRINASGVVQWTADGVAVCTASNNQYRPIIVCDGAGGTIVTWFDSRSGSNTDIYAQRIDASGGVQWAADGVAISTAPNSQGLPTIISDGVGGAIITWQDHRSSSITYNPDVYAQRINSAGVVQWAADGVAISATTNWQEHPIIVSDGAGGAIITWEDSKSYSLLDIYAQRINANGEVQWATSGVPISTASNAQSSPWLVSDGAGGAIFMWNDLRSGTNMDIYAQRINASGVVQWTSDGVPISTAPDMQITTRSGPQYLTTLASDGAEGAILTWVDSRIPYHDDIYAQRVRRDGTLGGNAAPLVDAGGPYNLNEGASVIVTASGSDPENGPLTYAWDLDNNGSFETFGQSVYFSATNLDGPSTHTIKVQATDNGGLKAVDQATVNVLNVAPTATFTGTPSTIIVGQSATLAFSNPFDPSAADVAAGFTYSYDCTNDGTFEIIDGAAATNYSCPYPTIGTFTAKGRIKDKDGNFTDYTVEIVVQPPLAADAGADQEVCAGQSTTIGGSPTGSGGIGTLTFSWLPITGLDNPSAANPNASPTVTTTYTVTVTDANLQTATDEATVTVNPLPTANAGPDRSMFFGFKAQLGGNPTASGGIPPYTYSWSPATGLDDATNPNPKAYVTGNVTYTVTVTDAKGCQASDQVMVNAQSFVFLADNLVQIGENEQSSGNIHSNQDVEFDQGALPGTHTGNLSAVNDIAIDTQNNIVGNATAGADIDLSGSATVTGVISENANVAAIPLPSLSFSVPSTAGDVIVPRNGTMTLAPGFYDRVEVKDRGTLVLSAGNYFMNILNTASAAILTLDVSGGTVNVHVVDELRFDTRVKVAITGSGAATDKVSFRTLQNTQVEIGSGAIIQGIIAAPKAEVHFAAGSTFKGSVMAKDITLDSKVMFSFHSPGVLTKKSGVDASGTLEAAGDLLSVTSYQLAQNSPNPFNPTTTIQFSVPREGYVRLKIYNSFGAEVATLVDRQVAAGTYKVNWDASRLASGFYLYRLEAEGFAQTKKLLLMK